MKKILVIFVSLFFAICNSFAMISPDSMLEIIQDSEIKTPAKITKIKTIENHKNTKLLEVEFEGLYQNKGKKYKAKCYTYKKTIIHYALMTGGPVYYNPQKNTKVYVTIDKDNGNITSMVNMTEDFENQLKNNPKDLKFDCMGAYFEVK